jgi:von Willebrand factor type A C-terminal domain
VIDPVTGTARLKTAVADADEMTLDTRSSKTGVRANKQRGRQQAPHQLVATPENARTDCSVPFDPRDDAIDRKRKIGVIR